MKRSHCIYSLALLLSGSLSNWASASNFWIIDSQKNEKIVQITDGLILNEDSIPFKHSLSFEEPFQTNEVVRINLAGPVSGWNDERRAPYTLYGDNAKTKNYNDNPPGKELIPGNYTLSVKGKKTQSDNEQSVSFTIESEAEYTPPIPSYFYLYDAKSDQRLMKIDDGQTLNLSDMPDQFSLSYEPPEVHTVMLPVVVTLTGINSNLNIKGQNENYAPYAMFGNKGLDFKPDPQSRQLGVGKYALSANGEQIEFGIVADDIPEPFDSDGDGIPDDRDAFPNDPQESQDSDSDGVGDNADPAPNDPEIPNNMPQNQLPEVVFKQPVNGASLLEGSDLYVLVDAVDKDGAVANVKLSINNNFIRQEKVIPYEWGANDAALSNLVEGSYLLTAVAEDDKGGQSSSTINITVVAPTPKPDLDGDGVPDDQDAFPNDETESQDSDADGVGDNADRFPNDPSESADTDGDGVGDNSDPAPNDPNIPSDDIEDPKVSENPMQWHKVTVTYNSAERYDESGGTNPFTHRRLDVIFTKGSDSYRVPGYFAADGNAGDTGATGGNVWKTHFAPPAPGVWTYRGSFYHGRNIHAVDTPSNPVDTFSGTFTVVETDKDPSGRDFRGKGWLEYVGERYLRFKGNGEYFLKQGPDSPENLLAYAGFDGNFKSDGEQDGRIKQYNQHINDWNAGDPTWAGGKGKGIIGAINYLASEGLNAFSFLTMNIEGDDDNVFPYVDYKKYDQIDVSRMDQWGIVFEHGTQLGMFLHFKTQETENEQELDNGDTGPERRLYYRELMARFGHNLALNWNLGEENGQQASQNQSTAQRRAMAQYFYENDPYRHHTVLHNGKNGNDMYGNQSKLTGWSLQTSNQDFRSVHDSVKRYIRESTASGKTWAVACDEPGDAQFAIRPDNDAGNSHENGRKNALWGTFMAGGWGNEWYFGYDKAHSDLSLQDFRSRDDWWDYSRYALAFFKDNNIPFWDMDNRDANRNDVYMLAKEGEVYVVYLKNGGSYNLNVQGAQGKLDVMWFNPRKGGQLQFGTVNSITNNGTYNIGEPLTDKNQDWVAVVGVNNLGLDLPPQPEVDDPGGNPNDDDTINTAQNGLVIMEAENTPSALGEWLFGESLVGYTGNGYLAFDGNTYINGPANSPLNYAFTVNEDGLYYLHLRLAKETINGRTDVANDVYVRLEGDFDECPNAGDEHGNNARLSLLKADTKFFGGLADRFGWASGNHLDPGGHKNKRIACYRLKADEQYTFVMSGRSRFTKVDRVVFRNESVSSNVAQDLANRETGSMSD